METWIAKRIRSVSFRRVFVWTLVLIIGVLLATSDRRYVANFMGGPYALTRSDLDSIRDVEMTPRYYARVSGDKVLDTGLRQYRVHTQNGVETSREESGAYRAIMMGNRFLVVRTADAESPVAVGKLIPVSDELDRQLFDSKEMQSLRSNFYSFYLDTDSFRRPGYVVIAVGIVFLLLFVWQVLPAWRAWRNPEHHPLAKRIATWGDPVGVAVAAEQEWEHALLRPGGGWRFGKQYLIKSSFFSVQVLRFRDVLWSYKKITKRSVNFIPVGKSYEAIVHCHGGTATISGNEKRVHEILGFVQQQAPWSILGWSQQLADTFNKRVGDFAGSVEQRRQQWEQQGGKV